MSAQVQQGAARSPSQQQRRHSPSPPPRRPRHRDAGRREVVVERVVKEVGGGNYPTLTRTNYTEWSLLMKVKLQARGIWDAIELGADDFQEDRMALEAILQAVPPEMVPGLAVKRTAKEAWEAIRAMRVGSDRVRKGKVQQLKKEFEMISFRDGESVDDFALRLTNLVTSLATLGAPIDETQVVEKFLRVVPPRLSQIALAIETLLDTSDMSLEEVTGRLKAAEDRLESPEPLREQGKLLLTEEQWQQKMKERQGGSSSRPARGSAQRRRRPPRKNGGEGGSDHAAARDSPRNDTCRNCGRRGHWAKDCWQPRKTGNKAYLAQAEEDDEEPALLMAQVCDTPVPAMTVQQSEAPAPAMKVQKSDAPAPAMVVQQTVAPAPSIVVKDNTTTPPQHGPLHIDEPKAKAFLATSSDEERIEGWYLDTGATNHMTGCSNVFAEIDKTVTGTVKFGDGSVVEIRGIGTILFAGKKGEHKALSGVYYIPRLKNSIISIGQLDESDASVLIRRGVLRIWDKQGRLLVRVRRGRNRLYLLHLEVARPICLSARRDDVAWRWHERFGHLNFDALEKMGRLDMARGLPRLEHVQQFCDTCVITKHRRNAFPRQARYRAQKLLELVHGDLCGPILPATPGGRRYFLLLVDDATRYMWVMLLAAKNNAPDAIKRVQAAAEAQSGRKLRVFRTDNGGEFTSTEFAAYCADEGIQRHFSAPYAPQQNGVVERRNQTVVAMARALLKQKSMPAEFWGEAVSTAVFLLNRAPTKSLTGKTPYEAWHGRKPAVHYLRTFGCLAYVKYQGNLRKLDDRSSPAVFIGYEEGVKAYRLLDPATRRVRIARDVIFDEERGWDWATEGSEYPGSHFDIEYIIREPSQVSSSGEEESASLRHGAQGASASSPPSPPSAPATSATTPTTPEFVSPPVDDTDRLDAAHGDSPVRYRMVEDLVGGEEPVPGLAPRNLESELHLASTGEPCSFAEAECDKAWQAAMREEIEAVERNKTWELVDLPHGHQPIGLKWVYKLKKNEAGEVIKHKARLVARGFVQQAGIDFDEVFAPVARMESIRLLLALAAQEGWPVHHMDVKSAFLNGELKEEVYVKQPPGFVVKGEEGKVLRLRKALYGLRQAPRAWNVKLDCTLKEMGFKQSEHEHAIYQRITGNATLIIGVYVDDLIIIGSSKGAVESFKDEMKTKFEMSDLGLLSFYLGIEVQQHAEGISLCQAHYASRILQLGGMEGCNSAHTPMEERLRLSRESTAEEVDATEYRRIVGSLRYLVHTRPDLAFAVGFVSRFMERPTKEHMMAVKRILRYVAGTINYGLHYRRKTKEVRLIGYSDSDLAGDIDTRKSTSGTLFFLGNCLVSWQSLKQRVVAQSSCEAEYVAATTAANQGIWLARLLGELQGRKAETVELKVDNKSAIALAKNPVFHERSKHIDIRYHFIRDCLEDGSISTSFIKTSDQLADILTKSLGRMKFQELRARIGMVQIKSSLKSKD